MKNTHTLDPALAAYVAARSPEERGAIYSRDLADRFNRREPIHAANSLGTAAGDLVVQRTLDLMVQRIPLLTSIATDLSDEDGRLNQTVTIRTVTPPEAKTYSPETGYASSDAVTVDHELTINQHRHVQVAFNAEETAGTGRNLFEEQAEAVFAGLGNDLVAALLALITPANFPNSTMCSASNFTRSAVIGLAKALTTRSVPLSRRFLLLGMDHYAAIADDPAIVALATMKKEEIITEGTLPNIAGFVPYELATLPTTDSLAGFAARTDALLLAVRPARDYSQAFGQIASDGSVSIVKEPRTGLSAAVVRFIDHKLAKAYLRVAWFYGVAKGVANAGQRIVTPS